MLRSGHRWRRSLAASALILAVAFGLLGMVDQPLPVTRRDVLPHPLTLVALGSLAAALIRQRPLSRPARIERAMFAVAGGIAVGQITPDRLSFPVWSAHERMGTCTALAVVALVGAIAFRRRKPAWLAIALAVTSALICLYAVVGYAMGLGRVAGTPTPATLMVMMPLVAAALIGLAHRPAFRTLLRDDAVTRMLRRELALAILLPCAIAIVLFRLHPGGATAADALYTLAMILFCGTGVLVGGRLRDQLDCERRQLSRALHRASLEDPLTRLANRRGAVHLAEQAMEQARRSGRPVSMILCDLDHFKAINDRHGHGVGDGVLQQTASLLSDRLGREGVAARWGGEEFLFLLPDAPLGRARDLADAMRQDLRREMLVPTAGMPNGRRERVTVTASFGCALLDPSQPEAFERALEETDRALYAAKRAGRDRVVASPAREGARPRGPGAALA